MSLDIKNTSVRNYTFSSKIDLQDWIVIQKKLGSLQMVERIMSNSTSDVTGGHWR